MQYSQYQLDIFEEVKPKNKAHVAINSVAGSGKTSTAVKSIEHIPTFYTVQFCAFGKDIANELLKRNLPKNCTIATYNAFGWGILRKSLGRIQFDEDKTDKILQYKVLGASYEDAESIKKFYKYKFPIKRLTSLFKGSCIFNVDDAFKALPTLVEHYAIDVPAEPDFIQVLLDTFKMAIEHKFFYDYDDQIYQVLHNDLLVPAFDYVFVDEFQDTNEMQLRLMQLASHGGRFFGIGDPDQSIFGFRGATPDQFGKFIKEFNAKEMPLSICYRCPKAAIRQAQKIVPRIEAAPWAKEGVFDTIDGSYLCKYPPVKSRCLWHLSR